MIPYSGSASLGSAWGPKRGQAGPGRRNALGQHRLADTWLAFDRDQPELAVPYRGHHIRQAGPLRSRPAKTSPPVLLPAESQNQV
jgi:hypothetical protein